MLGPGNITKSIWPEIPGPWSVVYFSVCWSYTLLSVPAQAPQRGRGRGRGSGRDQGTQGRRGRGRGRQRLPAAADHIIGEDNGGAALAILGEFEPGVYLCRSALVGRRRQSIQAVGMQCFEHDPLSAR